MWTRLSTRPVAPLTTERPLLNGREGRGNYSDGSLFSIPYSHRLNALQDHSLMALQNLISALPPSGWGGGDSMAAMWSSLLTLLEAGGEFLHGEAIAGALMVLIEKLNTLGVEVS